ncbi:hypothetical protein Tco_0698368 [Tanacetum coccineum]
MTSMSNDPVPEDGFNASDVQLGNLVRISSFPLHVWSFYFKGTSPHFSKSHQTTYHSSPSFRLSEKTDHQKRVEVEDPKIVAIRERKARAAAKKREKKEKVETSPRPLRTFDPNQTNPSDAAATTTESQEDRSPLSSPRGFAAHSVNYYVAYLHHSAHHSPPVTQMASLMRSIQRGNVDEGKSSRGRALYVPDWSWHRRCRLDTLAWALAQTDILERFEHLQTDFDRLAEEHAGCEDTIRQFVSARELSQQDSRLYLDISERFRKFKNDHANCPNRIRLLED